MRFRPSSNYLHINIQLSQYHFLIKLSSVQLSLHLCQKKYQFSPLVWVDFYTLTQWHELANDFIIILLASVAWFRRRQWAMAHSSTLTWKIPWTEGLVGCTPWGREESDTTEQLHFHFHALEKEMETHSSVLAWRIPVTGELRGLPSMGSHRVRHDWSDLAAAAAWFTFSFLIFIINAFAFFSHWYFYLDTDQF